jgi:hypothetical protein
MRRLILCGLILIAGGLILAPLSRASAQGILISPTPSPTPEPPTPEASPMSIALIAPQADEEIQGAYVIVGTSAQPGFASAELSFAYAGDSTGTWYLISENVPAVVESDLAAWDTTKVTDGFYILRLRVLLADNSAREATARVRVRNYTPADTPTPTPVTPTDIPIYTSTPTATITPTSTLFPTPTRLPPNPVELNTAEIGFYLARGSAAVVLLFGIFGLLIWLRRPR